MIIYFADRQLNILGQASTELPKGITITSDTKTEEVETGVNIFECYIPFKDTTRLDAESWAEVGNYLLRSHNGENEFYTIIESEVDTKNQEIYIYAEDAGMDLLNEVFGDFEADKAYAIEYYINKFAADSGFKIGINEASGLTRKLSWEGEATAASRIASVATQFDGCEISYTFDINGLMVTNKYINIFKQRGKDTGEQLRLNKEIDSIVTTKSIANLATALQCEGGVPDDAEIPITLNGYKYDDGDFYVDGLIVKSRKALERWRRFLWKNADTQQEGGHIVKQYSYDTTSQATLCARAVTELKKIRDMEVNYEININELPDNIKIGDRVNIIDDTGELYLSSRILKLQTSVADQKITATLGEYLLKTSGISEKVAELAAQFAKSTLSVKRAQQIANNAKEIAEEAKTQAETAATEAENANALATEAKAAAELVSETASNAKAEAEAAKAAANKAEQSVSSMETTIQNALQAAENAEQAADTAEEKATEAKQAANNAQKEATEAKEAAENAEDSALNALSSAAKAQQTANIAKSEAEAASATAIAAKLDAEQAEKDIAAFEENLETVSDTMKAEYARKTELTEAAESLQTQITRNAAGLESTAQKVLMIDETTNNALTKLEAAQKAVLLAQKQADEAAEEAENAQAAADEALIAANNAQAEADTARAAYETARSVADQAEADLLAAKKDFETISARADATEEEIAAAQALVNSAQITANNAISEANNAAVIAENAVNAAITAVDNANKAQITANNAAKVAELAQINAEEAQGNAEEAQATAEEAAQIAANAQAVADTAKATADTAQATANAAAEEAKNAQATANAANKLLTQANTELESARTRLENVLANVAATEEEIAEAEAAVTAAQAAADEAQASANTAQATATAAAEEAENAQAAADEAKAAATAAQNAADEAQNAADEAQGLVYALTKRITKANTKITQSAENIELRATKVEVAEEIGDVKAAAEDTSERITVAESVIKQLADSISMLVTDGNGVSLMTQTADGGWTFSTGSIQNAVNDTSGSLDDLTNQVGGIDAAVEILNDTVKELGTLSEYVKIGKYTYTDETGTEQTEPSIDLGENDTGFKLKITNTRIVFTDGANTLVSIDSKNKALRTQKVETEELQVGGWIWTTRNNGKNFGLVWKGATE